MFSATNLDEIQWRMEGTGLTPEKLKKMLKENKEIIQDIIDVEDVNADKFKNFFYLDDFVDVNYSKIFKNN